MSADAPAPSRVKRWLREPLLHFLLIGFGLFAVYSALNPQSGDRYQSNQIRLTQDDLRQMAVVWAAKWQRPPTPEEPYNLIGTWLLSSRSRRAACRPSRKSSRT